MIEQDKEYDCKAVDLDLGLKRVSLCVYDSGYDVDKSHQYREDIYREAADHECRIFNAEISDKAELRALQALHSGKKSVCSDEERYLQEQRY